MTESLTEVDMRAGRGIRWSDVAADIEAGNPVEPAASEPLGVTPAGDLVFHSIFWGWGRGTRR
jgi:hypothetical protein